MAREAGLLLQQIPGTGPGGRVVRRDVEAAVAARTPAMQQPAGPPASAPEPPTISDEDSRPIEIPHTRLRRAIATRLVESKNSAPHFYLRGTAQVDRLLQLREEINQGVDRRVSVTDLLVKAMGKTHQAVPAMNVVWTDDSVRQFASVDISVAIATDAGLVTPVLRGVERMTVTQIADAARDYAERARSGRLQQHELEGGSCSISNLGMYGTEEFTAIINPPQASILAVGATRREAVVRGDEVVVCNVLKVTLSVDHRPIDGVVAAQWMGAFVSLLENPAQILS